MAEVIEQVGIEFPNILDTSREATTAFQKYETLVGYTAVPVTYIIDRQGAVIDAWYGYQKEKTESILKKLQLQESP